MQGCGAARQTAGHSTSLRWLPPTVAQTDDAIEYGFARLRVVTVGDEVAVPFELHTILGLHRGRTRFEKGLHDALRIRIEYGEVVTPARIGLGLGEQPVIEPYLGLVRFVALTQ